MKALCTSLDVICLIYKSCQEMLLPLLMVDGMCYRLLCRSRLEATANFHNVWGIWFCDSGFSDYVLNQLSSENLHVFECSVYENKEIAFSVHF